MPMDNRRYAISLSLVEKRELLYALSIRTNYVETGCVELSQSLQNRQASMKNCKNLQQGNKSI